MDYQEHIKQHYLKNWHVEPNVHYFHEGPIRQLSFDFRILEFPPSDKRNMWTYATCCMSQKDDYSGIELHIFSSKRDTGVVELLTTVAHYHRTGKKLNLNHIVNFGQPWQDTSNCIYGFISLPYLDGQGLENLQTEFNIVKCYWLIPITESERVFALSNGTDSLEEMFEAKRINYLDPNRISVA